MSIADAEPPDRLRQVGAAVAVMLLVVAAVLAGIVAWESLRAADGNGRTPAVAAIPEATADLPPPAVSEPAAQSETVPEATDQAEATVAPIAGEVASEPILEPAPALPDAVVAEQGEEATAEPTQVAALGVGALRPAPDPAVLEQSPLGPLPRIGSDGLEPWRVYARPFDATDLRPRVAVVLSGLGLSNAATEAAIQGLPGGVTLAFQPYSDGLQRWIGLARAAGHETLLNLPMEPQDYPQSDPGPQALFTSLSAAQNVQRLEWALSRVTGYVGVMNHMGSQFLSKPEAVEPVMQQLRGRGLLFLDDGVLQASVGAAVATNQGVPHAIGDRFVDNEEISRVAIDRQLAEVERIALEIGAAVAVAQPYPVTLERLRVWLLSLEDKGIALAPVSAVVNLQADR